MAVTAVASALAKVRRTIADKYDRIIFNKRELRAVERALAGQPEPSRGPTEDAYMAACRALHWHTAQLRAHDIEPDAIPHDAPHYPPEGHVFDSVRDRAGGELAIAIGEHAFNAGHMAGTKLFNVHADYATERAMAWSQYDPPEELKGLV